MYNLGTPAGVSGVRHGDIIKANLSDLVSFKFPVIEIGK
jgi:hypothetical protein